MIMRHLKTRDITKAIRRKLLKIRTRLRRGYRNWVVEQQRKKKDGPKAAKTRRQKWERSTAREKVDYLLNKRHGKKVSSIKDHHGNLTLAPEKIIKELKRRFTRLFKRGSGRAKRWDRTLCG